MQWIYLFVCILAVPASALDNGLALTPPMGWMSWLYIGCTTDCDNNKTCLNEEFIKRTADRMVADGYKEAGYEYVIIDDCWLEKQRENGKMVPDRKRFKSGMKALADYIHSKGLKFGMYQDIGTYTCEKYPGLKGHEKIDAASFASWEIDYLKVDACYESSNQLHVAFPAFGKILNETGRPILYSVCWPNHTPYKTTNFTAIAEHSNIWRNYDDVRTRWSSIESIMDYFGERPELKNYAGPGHFNDPDMLVVGNPQITVDQARAQMAVWSILAGPLLMSTDLDLVKSEYKEILLNKDIITVSQDPLGQMGRRIHKYKGTEVWARCIKTGTAIAFVNRNKDLASGNFTHNDLTLPNVDFVVTDYFKEDKAQIFPKDGKLSVHVNGTGVKFYHFRVKSDSNKTSLWQPKDINNIEKLK